MLAAKVAACASLFLSLSAFAQSIPMEPLAFTEYGAEALRRAAGPELTVTVKGPLTLSVDGMQANLDRVYRFCRDNPTPCATELDLYMKKVSSVIKERNAPVDRRAVLLAIRNSDYLKRAQQAMGGGPPLQVRPLVDGLVIVAVLDTPSATRPLTAADVEKLGISQDDLFALAAQNLQGALKPLAEAKAAGKGEIGTLRGGFYETSRVASLAEWSGLAQSQQGTLLIAMPTTDVVLYISQATPVAIDALRTLAKTVAGKSPNPLSTAVLRWTPERWTVE